ncbi:MAG: hypothetical protein WC069_03520 [Candidatus Shapirobacteria bacterium]
MIKKNDTTLFIMGLITGAIIASFVILVSAEDKAKIVNKIKNKFNDLFGDKPIVKKTKKIIASKIIEPIKKISVDLPKDVETLNLTPVKTVKPKMVFKKSK